MKIDEYRILLKRAEGFYKTALFQLDNGLFDLAAFSLEQYLQLFIKAVLLKNGVDFLGFRVYRHKRRIRKSSVMRFKKKFKKMKQKYFAGEVSLKEVQNWLCSYLGHWKWANTYRLRLKLLGV